MSVSEAYDDVMWPRVTNQERLAGHRKLLTNFSDKVIKDQSNGHNQTLSQGSSASVMTQVPNNRSRQVLSTSQHVWGRAQGGAEAAASATSSRCGRRPRPPTFCSTLYKFACTGRLINMSQVKAGTGVCQGHKEVADPHLFWNDSKPAQRYDDTHEFSTLERVPLSFCRHLEFELNRTSFFLTLDHSWSHQVRL